MKLLKPRTLSPTKQIVAGVGTILSLTLFLTVAVRFFQIWDAQQGELIYVTERYLATEKDFLLLADHPLAFEGEFTAFGKDGWGRETFNLIGEREIDGDHKTITYSCVPKNHGEAKWKIMVTRTGQMAKGLPGRVFVKGFGQVQQRSIGRTDDSIRVPMGECVITEYRPISSGSR